MKYADFRQLVDSSQYEEVKSVSVGGTMKLIVTQNGVTFITGDRYDWQVVRLFDNAADITVDELRNLGEMITTITERRDKELPF